MIGNIPVDPKVTTKDGFMRDTGKIVTAFLLAVALFLQTGMVGAVSYTHLTPSGWQFIMLLLLGMRAA